MSNEDYRLTMLGDKTMLFGSAAETEGLRSKSAERTVGGSILNIASRGMVQDQVSVQCGWGRRPEDDAPRAGASALGASRPAPARPQPPSSCHLHLRLILDPLATTCP